MIKWNIIFNVSNLIRRYFKRELTPLNEREVKHEKELIKTRVSISGF